MDGRGEEGVFRHGYHPVLAGSIDGTDRFPHDKAITRACSALLHGKYDPGCDPKIIGDPKNTVFVGRIDFEVDEDALADSFARFGIVKAVRLVRDVATGMSRGYGFVEFSSSADCQDAYQRGHRMRIGTREVLVEKVRGGAMEGWVPRRFGGGLGGRKESGQMRFGGRDRPHRRPGGGFGRGGWRGRQAVQK